MKIIKKSLSVLGVLSLSSMAIAADTTGTISVLRATTDLTSASQQRMFFIQLSSAIHPNCNWITVDPGNDYFASTLLSAEARSKSVRIWYDEVNADANKLCKTKQQGQP